MQKNEIPRIDTIAKDEISKIRDYFHSLNKDETASDVFIERINDELPARIEYLDGVINKGSSSPKGQSNVRFSQL